MHLMIRIPAQTGKYTTSNNIGETRMKTSSLASALFRIGVVTLVLTIVACSQEPASEAVAERTVGEGVKSGPGTSGGQWEFLGGDAAHTRYSPADEITPENFEDLEELPGVGHKTASVVMSQAFGYPAFPVDTHIHRLAQRWKLTSGKNVVQTEKDLKRLFPKERWNELHLQMIYYGREHCSARGCDGTVCEICRALFPDRKRSVKTEK